MSDPKPAMRSPKDRIRHAVSFEIVGLIILIPIAGLILGNPIHEIGLVTVVSSIIATAWNYAYNVGFDHAMARLRGDVHKTVPIRVLHAVLFETGLVLILWPFIVWILGVSWGAAFLIDISFAGFYIVYAFVYNWVYDLVFPIPNDPKPPNAPR